MPLPRSTARSGVAPSVQAVLEVEAEVPGAHYSLPAGGASTWWAVILPGICRYSREVGTGSRKWVPSSSRYVMTRKKASALSFNYSNPFTFTVICVYSFPFTFNWLYILIFLSLISIPSLSLSLVYIPSFVWDFVFIHSTSLVIGFCFFTLSNPLNCLILLFVCIISNFSLSPNSPLYLFPFF